MANMHSHDDLTSHSHDHPGFDAAEHGHSHEILDGPGSYMGREMPLIEGRDWRDRAFTVGIGGYAPCDQFYLQRTQEWSRAGDFCYDILLDWGDQGGSFEKTMLMSM